MDESGQKIGAAMKALSRAAKRTLLLLIMVPAVSVDASEPPCSTARSVLMAYDKAIEMYVNDRGHLPAQEHWFELLVQEGSIGRSHPRNDPWGNAYVYSVHGATYDLRSVGPDGEPETTDDQSKGNDWQWKSCRHTARSWFKCR